MKDILKAYYKENKHAPEKIIYYREGVASSQIPAFMNIELKEIIASFHDIDTKYDPGLAVVLVDKKV